jgi:hypothetical protein
MAAAKLTLTIEQGATFQMSLTLKNSSTGAALDLTSWSNFRGQVRKSASDSAVLASFTISRNSPATDGVLNISMAAADTLGLPPDNLAYDIFATDGNSTTLKLMEGAVIVDPAVTR